VQKTGTTYPDLEPGIAYNKFWNSIWVPSSCYKSPLFSRDVHETFWTETETRPETHVSPRPRHSKLCSRRDV